MVARAASWLWYPVLSVLAAARWEGPDFELISHLQALTWNIWATKIRLTSFLPRAVFGVWGFVIASRPLNC